MYPDAVDIGWRKAARFIWLMGVSGFGGQMQRVGTAVTA